MGFCGHISFRVPEDNKMFVAIVNTSLSLAVAHGPDMREYIDHLIEPFKEDCELMIPCLYVWVQLAHQAASQLHQCDNPSCPGFGLDVSDEALEGKDDIKDIAPIAASFIADCKDSEPSIVMGQLHSALHRLNSEQKERMTWIIIANCSEFIGQMLKAEQVKSAVMQMIASEEAEESLKNIDTPADIPGINFDL